MASEKRKAAADARPNKKAKTSNQQIQKAHEERNPVTKSVLLQEEKAFPRGGASVLSPLEQKQVRAQAERDVLFEQQTGQKTDRSADQELFDDEATTVTKPKKRKREQKASIGDNIKDEESVKIHGLSYKSLIPGSLVLGCITSITTKDLALALPNNLTGFIPITAISSRLNERIEALLDNESEDDIELKHLFHVGQWLRAVVMETTDSKNKRHIELSIEPSLVNAQLQTDDITVNCFIQASVRSIEDHGVIMDLGLSSKTTKGFVSKKELGYTYKVDELKEGQTMLCIVTGKGSDGKVLKLSPDASKFWASNAGKSTTILSDVPNIEAFLPGVAVDILITNTSLKGLTGKIMGMVDVMADIVHSGAGTSSLEEFQQSYKISSKTKARIIWSLPSEDGGHSIGVSVLPHMLALPPTTAHLGPNPSEKARVQAKISQQQIEHSTTCDKATVVSVLPDRGVYLKLVLAEEYYQAFAHISQLADTRIDDLTTSTGKYKIGSEHRARIIGFNSVDALYYVSLQDSILKQAFLRLEDLKPGQLVDGTVDRLMLGGTTGLTGVLIKLGGSITALVPTLHMSDGVLSHPERKFREGASVKGRVLSVDIDRKQARVTLKKTLVNDDGEIWADYASLTQGQEARGIVIKLLDNAALIQYYGQIRGYLPVSEMSEGYVESPSKHFKLGQTITTRIIEINAEAEQLRVSCKAAAGLDEFTQKAWDALQPGMVVSVNISAILTEKIEVELEGGVKGFIRTQHLADGSINKAQSMHNKLRIGQKLTETVILNKMERSSQVMLSYKSSLVSDAKSNKLICSIADVKTGNTVHGWIQNITAEGVYVEFANNTVALLPKSQLSPESTSQSAFGLRKDQSISCRVLNVDEIRQRFALTMREPIKPDPKTIEQGIEQPVDSSLQSTADLTLKKVIKVKVASVKSSQVNVRLAEGIHGRIDVSEVFDFFTDITNHKSPLQNRYKPDDIIDVKVLGIRDARGYRFLPFSHRGRSNAIVELSAKPSRVSKGDESLLEGLSELHEGKTYTGFVNNIMEDCVWVNLSPSIRGRISLMDLSDDASQLQNLQKAFPVGSALQVKVLKVSAEKNRLDLSARAGDAASIISLESLEAGEVVPGRVTKIGEASVIVQLADNLASPVPLVELADDLDKADPTQFTKNEVVRVRVLKVDRVNKRLSLSIRPSLVLSSSLPIKDPHFNDLSSLKLDSLVRGFVKHIGDKGVVVALSGTVDAFVRIADLSDAFLKDWQSHLQLNQLVQGRVLEIDSVSKHVRLSLKASHVDENYTPPHKIDTLKIGMVVTGKVRKVEEFGVFIDIDRTQPRLSGLAHRSEIAERRIADVRGLYSPGDIVKAKVLKVEVESRKISLGLKASYFKDVESDHEMGGVDVDERSDAEELDDVDLDDVDPDDVETFRESEDLEAIESEDEEPRATTGLSTSGFDWDGDAMDTAEQYESEPELVTKKKRNKAEIKVDLTGDLDKYGPRSTDDFERQLLGQPNDSALWIQYMAFHLRQSEIQKARDTAERALRTIHIRDADEKANVWIALLNLEAEYGDDDSVEEAFKKACQLQDSLTMHEKLASIYIDSGRHEKAEAIFERIISNKAFRASPEVWLNYATFLLMQLHQSDRARALLPRALQSVHNREHRLLTAKFAALEFRTGDAERGRTIFEGIMSEFSSWTTGWDMWVDIERSIAERVDTKEAREAYERVRKLYERMIAAGMKKRRARFVFKRWSEFEEEHGDMKTQDRVRALAQEYNEKSPTDEV